MQANQLYLEFLQFNLAGPNATGLCGTDSFTISVPGTGVTTNYPIACGDNTGQTGDIYICDLHGHL